MNRVMLFLYSCVAVLFTTCSSERHHEVDFYYWKSKYAIGKTERAYLSKMESKRLFVRLFDVDMQDGMAIPIGQIHGLSKEQIPIDSIRVIPVVFITNQTFLSNVADKDIERLASNVSNAIAYIMDKTGVEYDEIQIDCDWTELTRVAYFKFLKTLAETSHRSISCTLRLHQIRDRKKTGVPPVIRVSLMCYATSNPMENDTRNSILDMELLKAYTTNINDYPLDFDVILPIYSWGIVTNHLGQVKLVNGLTEADLQTPMFEKTDENLYLVKKDGFLQGLYVNSGFVVKIETITPELLAEAKRYLDRQIDRDFPWIYFHLSQGFLTRFTIENLK